MFNQVKYSFMAYQKSSEEIDKMREKLNDPKWRPNPLCVVNVSVVLEFLVILLFISIDVIVDA